jgi:hypothetical protein
LGEQRSPKPPVGGSSPPTPASFCACELLVLPSLKISSGALLKKGSGLCPAKYISGVNLKWATLGSNQRPQSYQDCALTN